MTERRQAQAQLRLLEAVVARLNDVVLIMEAAPLNEPGPCIVFGNEAFECVTGYRQHDVLGRSPRFLQGPQPDMTELARIDALLAAGRSVRSECLNYTRQGQPYWVDIEIVPLHDDAGRTTHLVAVERDITDRKQAEADRDTLVPQLGEAQKMESIGTLAGGIVHDFDNILAAILGKVTLARGDLPQTYPAQSSLEQINKAGMRARSLVQQILTFSWRERNPMVAQPLRTVVDESLALLRATLPASAQLETVLPDSPLMVDADATQLQQVMMNLCTNAWQALLGGRGRIEVGFEALDDAAAISPPVPDPPSCPCVHLWVRDDGAGMDAARRERIFDPFFRTKPVGHGAGLGLSVAHGTVRNNGGAIRVDSEPGAGSIFHLYLPRLIATALPGRPTRARPGMLRAAAGSACPTSTTTR